MKNFLSAIGLGIFLVVFLASCKKESKNEVIINDYLPLNVGAKYRYIYGSYKRIQALGWMEKGECTWKFISVSAVTPLVYMVEQCFNGYRFEYDYSKEPYQYCTDSIKIVNQISTLSFKVRDYSKVEVALKWPWNIETFYRFNSTDAVDFCVHLGSTNYCLRKNVGITSYRTSSGGNNIRNSLSYTLLEGPYY
jgi:hypothetical protein